MPQFITTSKTNSSPKGCKSAEEQILWSKFPLKLLNRRASFVHILFFLPQSSLFWGHSDVRTTKTCHTKEKFFPRLCLFISPFPTRAIMFLRTENCNFWEIHLYNNLSEGPKTSIPKAHEADMWLKMDLSLTNAQVGNYLEDRSIKKKLVLVLRGRAMQ